MAYNHEYPYFDSGQFNVDWLLNTIKKIEEELSGTKTYDYKGENEVLDLNDLRPNSMASFTENFNVLNAPVSDVRRFVFTNGSVTGGFQRCYDIPKMEVYTRNFTITNGTYIWTSWEKTQNAPGLNIHNMPRFEKGSLNNLPLNTAVLVYNAGQVTDTPTRNSGHALTLKSPNDGSILQVWFDLGNYFIYLRSGLNGIWSAWQEANHIDFTNYMKYYSASVGTDLNTYIKQACTYVIDAINKPQGSGNGFLLVFGVQDGVIQYYYDWQLQHLHIRTKISSSWGAWLDVMSNEKILHRGTNLHPNNMYGARFNSGSFTGLGYAFVMGVGIDSTTTDTYQIGLTANSDLIARFRNNASWGNWVHYQKIAARTSLISSSVNSVISHDDDGNERVMLSDNLYSEFSYSTIPTFIDCPGQSLYHSDPDAQSYSEAILAREDLTNFDTIITNLEQWDMDIPLSELVEKTREFVQGIKDIHPLADIVILSVPPVDVPFLGEELYSYAWPSGNTLTEVDDALTVLAQEAEFSYITWKDYKHINNTNLRTFYDTLYEEPVYKRSLESYVSRQVKNCIE